MISGVVGFDDIFGHWPIQKCVSTFTFSLIFHENIYAHTFLELLCGPNQCSEHFKFDIKIDNDNDDGRQSTNIKTTLPCT